MIPVYEPVFAGLEREYLLECIDTGWLSSLGKYVKLFEEKFAGYAGVKHGVACSSGTAGLHTAVEILGIGAGDEVIIPDFSIIVSATAVMLAGAKPVLVDVEPDTWCIDPAKIEAAITTRTKAIMTVDMYGHPCDMDAIDAVARKHGLPVIADCCQSHGAAYKGKRTGSLARVSVFSFAGNKAITTGEGGMVLTDDDALAEKARLFINIGFEAPRYLHNIRGMNYRMTNMQAAVGLAQAERMDWISARKREIAQSYLEKLRGFGGVTPPVEKPWARNAYWMFSVLIDDDFGMTRDAVRTALREKGVDTRGFFFPMSRQPALRGTGPNFPDLSGSRPVSDDIARRGLYLPSGLKLTEPEIKYCADSLKDLRR